MADTENREDQKISECLREAFGYSDDQLLKQLDQANETFKDVNFTGAEDRLMKRFLARKAELEKETVSQTPTLVPQNESANIQIAEELPKKTVTVISEAEEKKKNEKKVIRFGKKKVLATAALVAVIAGMLGGTAIGKKSYFFRQTGKPTKIFLDNDKNNFNESQLEKVYDAVKKQLDIPFLKFGYCPEEMMYDSFETYKDGIDIQFLYRDNVIYLVQRKKETNSSTGAGSDRLVSQEVTNKWMNRKIEYSVNNLENGEQECEAMITFNNNYYYIHGCISETEFKEILEYLYFY
ncbi:hypothetical protein [Clostridium sp. AM25-23AC]|uniref:hypothetical protein n=1 Tax=Clostridium sp. AM25-23AC TaxID=2305240 RepID=UPI000E41EE1C|nr:hypothetical protein [Clostridium sp. AM25-23AC]RGD94908.1 hypothetical protein DW677_11160 [Clostridium sp. AM25-23AC]